jgi:hypothetical protein
LRNSCPLRSSPLSPSSPPQYQKAPSFTKDPPPPYSLLSSLPSYSCTSTSTSPLSSPPTTRQTYTHTFLVPCPALRIPATTPTSTPFLSRTVRTFGLHKRSLSTETFYVSSPTVKTSLRHSPTLSPLLGLKSFIWSLYRQQALSLPSSCAPKLGTTPTPLPSPSVA